MRSKLILAILVSLLPAGAALGQTGVDRFNQDVAGQWGKFLRPEIEKRLPAQLAGLAPRKMGVFELEKVDQVRTSLANPPEVQRLDRARLAFRLPGQGGWDLFARAHLALRVKVFGIQLVYKAPIDVDVTGFAASLAADMKGTDARPRIDDASTRVDFHLRLSSPDPVFGLATRLTTWLFEKVLRGPVLAILSELVREKLLPLVKGEPDGWGEGGPAVETGPNVSLAARAREIESTIASDMLPYGTLLVPRYSSPVPGQGTVVNYQDHGDSAIWTGHYIVSQVFRHRATGDPDARANALRALGGIDDLFEVTGGNGILARAAAPASSQDGQDLLAGGGPHHRRTLRGVDTVGWGADFISRDQYVGVMAGMGFADLEFGSDPNVRAIVKKNVGAAVGRFLRDDWIVFFDDGRFSTTFATRFEQQLALLALARRVDPTTFDQAFRDRAPTAELVWFAPWTETWDPHGSYYKFNLDHTAFALLMTLDQDPGRWREYHRGLRVLRQALDHHENAWFMSVEMLVDPASRATLGPRTENALRLWTKRNVRAVSVDPNRIRALPTAPYTDKITSAVEYIAVHPVPIELRYITDFLWQRSPFGIHVMNDPALEYPGVDLILPYWIGRDLGLYP